MPNMNTISRKELLDYYYSEFKKFCESQFYKIDENYCLILNEKLYKPEFKIEDHDNKFIIIIKYPEYPILELSMTKPKHIKKENNLYEFKTII